MVTSQRNCFSNGEISHDLRLFSLETSCQFFFILRFLTGPSTFLLQNFSESSFHCYLPNSIGNLDCHLVSHTQIFTLRSETYFGLLMSRSYTFLLLYLMVLMYFCSSQVDVLQLSQIPKTVWTLAHFCCHCYPQV